MVKGSGGRKLKSSMYKDRVEGYGTGKRKTWEAGYDRHTDHEGHIYRDGVYENDSIGVALSYLSL